MFVKAAKNVNVKKRQIIEREKQFLEVIFSQDLHHTVRIHGLPAIFIY